MTPWLDSVAIVHLALDEPRGIAGNRGGTTIAQVTIMARNAPTQPSPTELDPVQDRERWLRRIDRALNELKGTDSPTMQALLRG